MTPKNKSIWRQHFQASKASLSAPEQAKKSAQLNQHLVESELFHHAQSIALYCSVPPEPTLSLVIATAHKNEKTLWLPRYEEPSGKYRFVAWARDAPLEKGPYNIPQPQRTLSEKAPIDLILVPGLAFDNGGNRLGHGAGIYDRLLAEKTAPRIGVAFAYQRVASLPTETHDVAMDYLLNENGLISV